MNLNKFKILLASSKEIKIDVSHVIFVTCSREIIIEMELYKLLEKWCVIDFELLKIIGKLDIFTRGEVYKFKKDVYNHFSNRLNKIEYVREICYFNILLFATADNIEILETLIYKIDDLKNIVNEYIKNKNLKINMGWRYDLFICPNNGSDTWLYRLFYCEYLFRIYNKRKNDDNSFIIIYKFINNGFN